DEVVAAGPMDTRSTDSVGGFRWISIKTSTIAAATGTRGAHSAARRQVRLRRWERNFCRNLNSTSGGASAEASASANAPNRSRVTSSLIRTPDHMFRQFIRQYQTPPAQPRAHGSDR